MPATDDGARARSLSPSPCHSPKFRPRPFGRSFGGRGRSLFTSSSVAKDVWEKPFQRPKTACTRICENRTHPRSLDSIGLNNESGDDSTKGSATKMREREREREKGAK